MLALNKRFAKYVLHAPALRIHHVSMDSFQTKNCKKLKVSHRTQCKSTITAKSIKLRSTPNQIEAKHALEITSLRSQNDKLSLRLQEATDRLQNVKYSAHTPQQTEAIVSASTTEDGPIYTRVNTTEANLESYISKHCHQHESTQHKLLDELVQNNAATLHRHSHFIEETINKMVREQRLSLAIQKLSS